MPSDHKRCLVCKEWDWFPGHQCAPIWEVRMHETKWEEDWSQIHALSASSAAEKFCDERDSGGDYDIIREGNAEIEVRKPGDAEVTIFDISAESVPQYTAYERI